MTVRLGIGHLAMVVALIIAGRAGAFATTATPTNTCACTVSPTRTPTCTPGVHPPPGCAYEGPTFTATASIGTPTPTCTPQSINTCQQNETISCTSSGGSCRMCECVTRTPTPTNTCACQLTPTASATVTRTCPPAATPPTCDDNASLVCGDERCAIDCVCATKTPTPTVPPTVATPPPETCVGDCDGDGTVRINELVTAVNVLLGSAPVSVCPAIDCPQPLPGVFINCAVAAVGAALNGCANSPVVDCSNAPEHQPCTGPCGPPECVIVAPGYCQHGRCVTDCAPCVTPTPDT